MSEQQHLNFKSMVGLRPFY